MSTGETKYQPKYRYGLKRDLGDIRDHWLSAPSPEAAATYPPVWTDMLTYAPDAYDQSSLGQCVGEGNSGAYATLIKREGLADAATFVPSPLFAYYNARIPEHTTKTDSGASVRDGLKGMAKYGVCSIEEWPEDITKFAVKPPAAAYTNAKSHLVTGYMAVPQTLAALKSALFTHGPVVYGISVYQSFEGDDVAKTGLVPMPKASEQLLGGHCTFLIGWDDTKAMPGGITGAFLAQNSWGASWGIQGCYYIPYPYVLSRTLASDFFCMEVALG